MVAKQAVSPGFVPLWSCQWHRRGYIHKRPRMPSLQRMPTPPPALIKFKTAVMTLAQCNSTLYNPTAMLVVPIPTLQQKMHVGTIFGDIGATAPRRAGIFDGAVPCRLYYAATDHPALMNIVAVLGLVPTSARLIHTCRSRVGSSTCQPYGGFQGLSPAVIPSA